MPVTPDALKPGEVGIRPRGDRYEVFWLDPANPRIVRRSMRPNVEAARAFALQKKQDLEEKKPESFEIPFADTVSGLSGELGGSWLELLWQGSLTVAMNPGSETAQKALRAVASATQAACRLIRKDSLLQKDEDVDDPEFREDMAEFVGVRLKAAGLKEGEVLKVCKVLRGPGAPAEEAK